MIIYFHIDELNRDAIVASALKKKCAAAGHVLIYGNRLTSRLVKIFHKAFDVIIMPRPHFLYDNWGETWMAWDSKFIMLSTESLGIICKDPHVMARTLLEREYFEGKKEYVHRIDAFCLWGERQKQAIKTYAPEIDHKVHVVGHPRHDALCRPYDIKRKIPEGIAKSKNIGVITRAVILNDYFGRSALEAFSTIFDNHFQYEYLNNETGEKLASKRPGAQPLEALIVQAIDVATTLKVLAALARSGHHISIRVHPKENAEEWISLINKCRIEAEISNPQMPISKWLNDRDFIVGAPSTSFYDATMLGVTPISIHNLDARRSDYVDTMWEDNNRLMPFIDKPETIDDLLNIVQEDYKNPLLQDILTVLKEEAYYPECRDALDRVVNLAINFGSMADRTLYLSAFLYAKKIFNVLWRTKSFVLSRKRNSAMFLLDRRTETYIDSLALHGAK